MKNKTTQEIIKALDEKYCASGQDKNIYLEGLLHSKPMNYWDYIHTDAKPKIADYEFTTLKPNLGIVKYRDFRTFIMADIPGIIEGASEGKGLGHYFLRHIERNSTLLFMIPSDSDDIVTSYKILLKELKKYNPEMLDKSRLIAITKSDLLDEELTREIELEIKGKIKEEFIFISSISNTGLTELKDKIWKMLN